MPSVIPQGAARLLQDVIGKRPNHSARTSTLSVTGFHSLLAELDWLDVEPTDPGGRIGDGRFGHGRGRNHVTLAGCLPRLEELFHLGHPPTNGFRHPLAIRLRIDAPLEDHAAGGDGNDEVRLVTTAKPDLIIGILANECFF